MLPPPGCGMSGRSGSPNDRRRPLAVDPSDANPSPHLLAGLAPLPAKPPALGLVLASPDAVLLIGRKGELEAVTLHRAGPADGLGRLQLGEGGACAPRREEEVGVDAPAGG